MVDKVEDMLMPNAVVQRIMKDALPDGISIAKDARAEIAKASAIFILYLTNTARTKTKKKTLAPEDVIHALEAMEMEHFIEPLKKALEQYKNQQKNKKAKKQTSPTANKETAEGAAEAEETEDLPAAEDLPETEQMDTETPDPAERL